MFFSPAHGGPMAVAPVKTPAFTTPGGSYECEIPSGLTDASFDGHLS
jgi:hypothetical protein